MAEVEVFADVWCPFTHVGLRRFVAERARRGSDLRLRVRAWPLELVNGEPLDPGVVAGEIAAIRSATSPELFAGFHPTAFPRSTLPALRLTAAAYGRSPAAGEAVALDLRDRLFERGLDVASPAVLAEVATFHGLPPGAAESDPQVVERDLAEGRARGVVGSPHFFTPGGDFFCPALDVRHVDGHLRITADPERFRRFLDGCFDAA